MRTSEHQPLLETPGSRFSILKHFISATSVSNYALFHLCFQAKLLMATKVEGSSRIWFAFDVTPKRCFDYTYMCLASVLACLFDTTIGCLLLIVYQHEATVDAYAVIYPGDYLGVELAGRDALF